jgi:diaminopimelate decarboxylase
MDHFQLRDGILHCEDVPLPEIAGAVGTPVYVYSTATMVRHVEVLRAALEPLPDPLIAYAVKANPNAAVLATLAGKGLGADVVSGGEYRRARAAGIAADRIVFSGVGKTEEEMRLALAGGLFQFNLESVEEAEMLSGVATAMGLEAPVGFRINPDVAAGSHAKISTGGAENKFGVGIGDARAAYARAAALPGLRVQGVAVHIGSQLTSLAPLEAAFAKIGALIGELRDQGVAIHVADLGGGLGVPYDPAMPPPPSPRDYGAMVRRVAGGWDARLVFEPGRLIMGNAGVLLTRVIRVKPGSASPFLIVDAAMNDLMRPALYDAWHAIDAVAPKGGKATVNVVGPVCETGDTFATGREMDRVGPGELVTPEVLVRGDRWAVVRKRVEIDALMAGDAIPDWVGA